MSYQAVKWALYKAPLPLLASGHPDATAQSVLVVLAEHANDEGRNTYPSIARIQFAAKMDERTVQRALRRLEDAGLIAPVGVSTAGTIVWALAIEREQSAGAWDDFLAQVEERRAVEAARSKRRRQAAKDAKSESDRT